MAQQVRFALKGHRAGVIYSWLFKYTQHTAEQLGPAAPTKADPVDVESRPDAHHIYVNIRENRSGNQEWTIPWQNCAHNLEQRGAKQKHNT